MQVWRFDSFVISDVCLILMHVSTYIHEALDFISLGNIGLNSYFLIKTTPMEDIYIHICIAYLPAARKFIEKLNNIK